MSTSTLVAASLTLKAAPPPWTVADTVLASHVPQPSKWVEEPGYVLACSGAEKIVHGDALTTFRPVEGGK